MALFASLLTIVFFCILHILHIICIFWLLTPCTNMPINFFCQDTEAPPNFCCVHRHVANENWWENEGTRNGHSAPLRSWTTCIWSASILTSRGPGGRDLAPKMGPCGFLVHFQTLFIFWFLISVKFPFQHRHICRLLIFSPLMTSLLRQLHVKWLSDWNPV